MIQRLKSLKKFDIVLYISILFALAAAYVFGRNTIKHNDCLRSLAALKQESVYNTQMLHHQLEDLGYLVNDKKPNANFNGINGDYSLKSMDEIIRILEEYPSDYDTAIHYDGIYSVGFGFPLFGMYEWEKFIANCRLNRPGYVVMAQFSANFVGTYYYIEYDGKRYHVVEDRSRDFDEGGTGYAEEYGRFLKVENYPTDAGFAEYAFITDDENMSYKKAEEYYVSDGVNMQSKPSFWDFYIGVYTNEIIDNLIMEPDRTSETFKSEYTGFLDRHPDFMEDNLRMDYDADGLLDRVYKDYLVFEDGKVINDAYLMFGNGENLLLGSNLLGDDCKTILADLDFDGDLDLSFIDFTDKPGEECARLSVFENRNGQFISVDLPRNEAKRIEMIVAESDNNNIFKFIRNDGSDTEYYVRWRDGEWMVQE